MIFSDVIDSDILSILFYRGRSRNIFREPLPDGFPGIVFSICRKQSILRSILCYSTIFFSIQHHNCPLAERLITSICFLILNFQRDFRTIPFISEFFRNLGQIPFFLCIAHGRIKRIYNCSYITISPVTICLIILFLSILIIHIINPT